MLRLPRCENMSDIDLYQQLVLRLPEALASKVQAVMNRTSEAVPIEVIPEELDDPRFVSFSIGEEVFPALVMNLPTNIETHKTFDHIHYYKSGDIGQMLRVFMDHDERDAAVEELGTTEGYYCAPSGITPPTAHIVKRKFVKTRLQQPAPPTVVAEVEEVLQTYSVTSEIEDIHEEVVDFEDWMVDDKNPTGKTIKFTLADLNASPLLQNHPEILLTSKELAEMEAWQQEEAEREAKEHEAPGEPGDLGEDNEEMEVEEENADSDEEDIADMFSSSDNSSSDDDFIKDVEAGVEEADET